MTEFLPDALRHHGAGRPRHGPARKAGGLMVRGVVVATYTPGERPDREDMEESQNPGHSCDVLVLDARFKTILRDVCILRESAGRNDAVVWKPRAATLGVGADGLSFDPKDPRIATNAIDTDGDVVVVGFLGDDLAQPIILGQIDHPKTNHKPTTTEETQYKWRRHTNGVMVGVTESGDIRVNLRDASTGTVDSQGAQVADGSGDLRIDFGNGKTLTVSLGAGSKVSVTLGGSVEKLLRESLLSDLKAALLEMQAFLATVGAGIPSGLAIPTTPHPAMDTLSANITTSLADDHPYLAKGLESE